MSSLRVGVTTFLSSAITYLINSTMRPIHDFFASRSALARSTRSPPALSSISLLLTGVPFICPFFLSEDRVSQGGQDSNLQPTVLETVALSIAPLPCVRTYPNAATA